MVDQHSQSQAMFYETARAMHSMATISLLRKIQGKVLFSEYDEPPCNKLRAVVDSFDKIETTNILPAVTTALKEKWFRSLTSPSEVSFSAKEIKHLCWTPDIAVSISFQKMIDNIKQYLPPSSVKGLLYSYHSKFDILAGNLIIEQILNERIIFFAKTDRYLAAWGKILTSIVGENAPHKLSLNIFNTATPPDDFFCSNALFGDTVFARNTAGETCLRYARIFSKLYIEKAESFLHKIISSPLIDRNVFKEAISIILNDKVITPENSHSDKILDFVLSSPILRDPRVFPENWVGVSADAKQKVIEWLSREDIHFFFELLISDRKDKQNRKSFWMDYVPHIARSRALLSSADRRKHSLKLDELEERGRTYGELTGSPCSAFILDFGRLVVLEFSEVGAIYVYGQDDFEKIFPNFWSSRVSAENLRNTRVAIEKIRHHTSAVNQDKDWRNIMRICMARYGLRR